MIAVILLGVLITIGVFSLPLFLPPSKQEDKLTDKHDESRRY
ncbi:hypothetical protein [Halobacillus locisalis]|nr:hypothetical protein [Halobacillus locisalis]